MDCLNSFKKLYRKKERKLNFGRGTNDGINYSFIVILRMIWNEKKFRNKEDSFEMKEDIILKNFV